MRPSTLTLPELADRAVLVAGALAAAGVRQGDRVCLYSPTSLRMLVTLFGIWRLGAVPVVLAVSPRDGAERDAVSLRGRIQACRPACLVAEDDAAGVLAARLPVPVRALSELTVPGAAVPPVPDADQFGLLQFTSGTTGAAKAVPVTHGQLVGNVRRCMDALGLEPGERYVSWLPFFHDMGIVSVTGLLANGLDVVVLATGTFVRQPASWLDTVSRYRAAVTSGPNSAYRLAARAQRLRPRPLDLSGLRVAINGAEPVTTAMIEESLPVFVAAGMRPEALCPTYGMAETTLVVTAADPREPIRLSPPPPAPPATGLARPDRALPSCGRPLADTEVVIRTEEGVDLPEGAVGELHVRGPGVLDRYWDARESAKSADGWFATGDLGFLEDGELYVCGRIKDMIIVGGRNLYAEDYETVAEQVAGVRAGNVIAFALPDEERMVVVAEGNGGAGALPSIGAALFDHLRRTVEHAPHEVVMVKAGTLPKTTSGKRQRRLCRDRYTAGELAVAHAVR
ncbi:AMP-binding protein [Amycolatopsis sp. YIM 10]|uniref:AMP-binding protein n=1 Tax=Amycolatopsis sp. YIM 10 TaxID=2653857 RepID=UPI0018846CEA|nr:AMP-binding protein [Amycolatopsis sp. YIM 10]